jgi:hypothetical protein
MAGSAADRSLQTFITAVLVALAAVLAAVLASDAGAAWASILHWAGELVLVAGVWLVATGSGVTSDWAVWLVSWSGPGSSEAEVAVAYRERWTTLAQRPWQRLRRGKPDVPGPMATGPMAAEPMAAEPMAAEPMAADRPYEEFGGLEGGAEPEESETTAWPEDNGPAEHALRRRALGVACLVLGILITAIFW